MEGMKVAKKKTSPITKARANVIKFCEILDKLPVGFILKLDNVSQEFDGSWEKIVLNGTTVWQNGARILFNSSFFVKRNQVLEAIEREGWLVRRLYFPDPKLKITSTLTKEKVKELYYGQKKSLQEIGREYGYSKQWIMLLMEKCGLKRRTLSEVQEIAINQGKRCQKRFISGSCW